MDQVSPPASEYQRASRTLFVAVAAIGFAQTVLFAILAPLGREIGLLEVQVGAIISASSLTIFLTSPWWGRTSDVHGRKKILLIGLFGYSVGTAVFAAVFQAALLGLLVPLVAFFGLTLARIGNATVMAAVHPAANAYMADMTSVATRTKGMAALGAAGNIGSMLGPAIGGLLAAFSLLTPLYFSVLLTLIAAVLVLFTLPERGKKSASHTPQRLSFFDPRVFPFVIIGTSLFMGFALVQQTIAFRFQDVLALDGAQTAQVTGISMMLSAAASLVAQMILIPRLELSPVKLLGVAMPIMICAFVTMAMSETRLLLTGAMVLMGLGLGFAGPGFMAGASLAVSAEEQGGVAGVAAACPPLGFTFGPLLGTLLYAQNPHYPYWFAALIYSALAVFMLYQRQLRQARKKRA